MSIERVGSCTRRRVYEHRGAHPSVFESAGFRHVQCFVWIRRRGIVFFSPVFTLLTVIGVCRADFGRRGEHCPPLAGLTGHLATSGSSERESRSFFTDPRIETRVHRPVSALDAKRRLPMGAVPLPPPAAGVAAGTHAQQQEAMSDGTRPDIDIIRLACGVDSHGRAGVFDVPARGSALAPFATDAPS